MNHIQEIYIFQYDKTPSYWTCSDRVQFYLSAYDFVWYTKWCKCTLIRLNFVLISLSCVRYHLLPILSVPLILDFLTIYNVTTPSLFWPFSGYSLLGNDRSVLRCSLFAIRSWLPMFGFCLARFPSCSLDVSVAYRRHIFVSLHIVDFIVNNVPMAFCFFSILFSSFFCVFGFSLCSFQSIHHPWHLNHLWNDAIDMKP